MIRTKNSKSQTIQPTLLDYAILGLIQETGRSGYNIRKVFKTTALGVYSSSPGSIYPALGRLQKNGLVAKKALEDSGKSRFHITQKGLDALKVWLIKPIEREDVEKRREELFLRFAFMENQVTASQRITFLRDFKHHLKAFLRELKEYHQEEADNLPVHGRLSFEHGIASCQTTLSWCTKTIRFFEKPE